MSSLVDEPVAVGLLEEAERRGRRELFRDRRVDPVPAFLPAQHQLEARAEPCADACYPASVGSQLAGAIDAEASAEQLDLELDG
jgi:hypothetical protein